MTFKMQRRGILLGLAALGGCSVAGTLRQAVDYRLVNDRLMMSGMITARTPLQFAEVLADNPGITTIVLQDMPGALDEAAALQMGYLIRQRGLHVALQSDSFLRGAAVFLLLAGTERRMVEGAQIGLRSWADGGGEGADYPADAAEHRLYLQYLRDMLGDEAFYWFALHAAPSDGIYIMNQEEIDRFGLLTQPVQAL
ncbi:MAG: alpha/beta hydrolase [Sulfitobacter sp.]